MRIRMPRMVVRDAQAQTSFEFRVGIAAVLVTVAALLAAVGAFVIPFGETVYRADFSNSGDVRNGDDVRVAGISLGKVRAVTLVGDHAEIAFGLDSKVRVGVDSHIAIRLLTPIGGRYLSIEPAGKDSAAGRIIPREHTRTPYDLTAALENATPPWPPSTSASSATPSPSSRARSISSRRRSTASSTASIGCPPS